MAGLNSRSNETAAIPNAFTAQQLICDLHQDLALQATLAKNDSQGLLEICLARGVYVDSTLLEQFIALLTTEEQDD